MSNDIHREQMAFDFEAPSTCTVDAQPETSAVFEQYATAVPLARNKPHLVLVVSQSSPKAKRKVLEPNSPEVTHIIRSAASAIGW